MLGFEELMPPQGEFRLQDPSLSIDGDVIRFEALLVGSRGADVWARAWISDDSGTLAETASPKAVAGDKVVIEVAAPPNLG